MNVVENKCYHVEKIAYDKYDYLVFAHNHLDPIEYLHEIASYIKEDNCTVIFDLLLKNGSRTDRFYSINYNNHRFDLTSLRHVANVSEDIREYCTDYFRRHLKLLENSILSDPIIFLIKKGRSI